MTERLQQAREFMRAAHRSIGQTRRDGVTPYEVHPEDVVRRLSEVTDDEDTLILGYTHDIIEDVFPINPYYDIPLIWVTFGEVVAKGAIELTDVYTREAWPDLNRKRRKQLERERYATFSPRAQMAKLADIASNTSQASDRGFMQMYLREKTLCLPYLNPCQTAQLPFFRERVELFQKAERILEDAKIQFDVR